MLVLKHKIGQAFDTVAKLKTNKYAGGVLSARLYAEGTLVDIMKTAWIDNQHIHIYSEITGYWPSCKGNLQLIIEKDGVTETNNQRIDIYA